MNRTVGLFVIVSGACLLVAGVLIYAGGLNWFGRLPGDIRYEGEHTQLLRANRFNADHLTGAQPNPLSDTSLLITPRRPPRLYKSYGQSKQPTRTL